MSQIRPELDKNKKGNRYLRHSIKLRADLSESSGGCCACAAVELLAKLILGVTAHYLYSADMVRVGRLMMFRRNGDPHRRRQFCVVSVAV